MMSPVILLHPDDNVLVCRRTIAAGERIAVEGAPDLEIRRSVELGHKLARYSLPAKSKVIKYGAPIGSMTEDVEAGDWIHLHNMKSDYISAHTRAVTGEEA
jgi:hypothetical protein